ncbi:MAG: flavodoxin family protein [Thermodesulfobacteriota bacterium]|nr:flavodoxin family protein [Thermodesulfobacteriota bacterium]
MHVLAFNGSPRETGNTSTIISAILEGAQAAGAETQEVKLHNINMKGCMGCLSCRKIPGICKQQDELSPYLEAMKSSNGIVIGCPIYMYRLAGQMKLLVDRIYSFYGSKEDGGYYSTLPSGKNFALVISQGAPQPDQYHRSIRWLAGMAGTGLGMAEIGRIIHTNSHVEPAKDNTELLENARLIGQKLIRHSD